MRRTAMKPGKGFKRPEIQRPAAKKLFPVKHSVGSVAVMRRADDAANELLAVPKQPREENPHYLAMAAGKPCMLQVVGVCCGDWSTTVMAHSNRLADNKGKSMKAHDHAGVWGCFTCHAWLDQGVAGKAEKGEVFDAAMARMRLEVSRIANDPRARPRDRDAAAWALARMRA